MNKIEETPKSDLAIIGLEDSRTRNKTQRELSKDDDDEDTQRTELIHKSGNSSSTDSNNGNSNNDSSPCTSDTG